MRSIKVQISLRSLISAYVFRCLDNIIPFKTLASFCSWADELESSLVANSEDLFSPDVAQLLFWYSEGEQTNMKPEDVDIQVGQKSGHLPLSQELDKIEYN